MLEKDFTLTLDFSDFGFGDAKFWVLIADEHTDNCWSTFLKEKSELKTKMIGLLRLAHSFEDCRD